MAEQIPRDFIDLLLAKIDLVDLINQHVPLRKKSGSNYFARCPFHDEKSGSFSVSQPKQFYYCFGCGAHGNAIDFVMQHDHLNFIDAIETLARFANMEVPREAGTAPKNDALPGLYDMATQAAAFYYEHMRKSERAIAYLKDRGISGAIAKQFSIGYAPNGWSNLLDALGKTDTDKKKLLDTGLIIKKNEGGYYDRFRDRIMFPIHDYRGRLIGFGGRIIDQGEPKYLNSPETPLFQKGHELYGLYQAIKSNRKLERLLLVEGYMDVIALFQHGISYAVATLGTATTAHHLQRLFRYTTEIIFCFDGDAAGRTAAWRALQVIFPLMTDSVQIRFLFLPDGEDPDTLVRKEGKPTFEQRITTALSLSAFFFQTLAKQSDMGTMEGRAQFTAAALPFIKQLPVGILQGILLDELAKRARVDAAALKQQLNSGIAKPVQVSPAAPQPEQKETFSAPARLALALLIQHPELATTIQETLPSLPDQGLFNQLLEMIRQKPNITMGTLIEHWRGRAEEALISKLAYFQHLIPETGIQAEFLGIIRQLTVMGLDKEIDALLAKAAQDGLTEDEKQTLTSAIAKKKALLGSLQGAHL